MVELDKRIKCDVRVMVVGSHAPDANIRKEKARFLGRTGIVTGMYGWSDSPYIIKFDDTETDILNHYSWRPTEIIYLEEQNYKR